MMKYPIGIQSFEVLRKGGYVYVDKTALIYKLVQGHVYFLCRPRRFGKSLLISTLEAYFQGRRDLFEGLAMDRLETEWQQHVVLHFDFNGIGQPDALKAYISKKLDTWEQEFSIDTSSLESLALRFRLMIETIHAKTGQRVVVLVDEYDKPLLDLLETGSPADERLLEENRDFLKDFFSVFKATDAHLRFVLLTGITKFSQISMFSGFNQPDDISLDHRYEALCGITEQELHTVFADPIRELADTLGQTVDETKAFLKERYDGYHFGDDLIDIYNPYSIINVFANNRVSDYWYASGTPSYLVRLLSKSQEDVMGYTGRFFPRRMFIDYKADKERPLPMIYQSGYLTVKAVKKQFDAYALDFPNNEVREGLVSLLANTYLQPKDDAGVWLFDAIDALNAGDVELFRRRLTAFLAETPYSMRPKKDQKDRELYFHYTFYLLLRLLSCYTVYTEKQLSEGRADCIIETPAHVYVFEFKLDGTADEALRQINDRGYATPYLADRRQLHLVGASFSSKTGTINDWKTEG